MAIGHWSVISFEDMWSAALCGFHGVEWKFPQECIYMVSFHINVTNMYVTHMIDDMTVSASLVPMQSSPDYKLINTKLFLVK